MAIYWLLAFLAVAGIAGVSWWVVSSRLSYSEASVVYDIEAAADFVAERLPALLNDRLDRPRVVAILIEHVACLRSAGLATFGLGDDVALAALASEEAIVVSEDDVVDFVTTRMVEAGWEGLWARGDELSAKGGASETDRSAQEPVDMAAVRDEMSVDVVVVLDLSFRYLRSIGAFGPSVPVG